MIRPPPQLSDDPSSSGNGREGERTGIRQNGCFPYVRWNNSCFDNCCRNNSCFDGGPCRFGRLVGGKRRHDYAVSGQATIPREGGGSLSTARKPYEIVRIRPPPQVADDDERRRPTPTSTPSGCVVLAATVRTLRNRKDTAPTASSADNTTTRRNANEQAVRPRW